jgi:spermidine/putrescine ABC transporter ATP-binding subunit
MASNRGHRLRLDNIGHRFGDFVAVHDINIDVAGGELVALLGPSGCGKSTLLRIVSGFIRQTQGRVLFDEEGVDHLPPSRRGVGIVFQNYALFPHMTIAENVAYGLQAQKWPRATIGPRVAEMLALVHMTEFAERKPRQLSGGQQQRVALARALINLPTVLLLDEPLGALDLKLRKGLQIELKNIQRDVGITFVYVTHDQEEALTMSDRIAVMNHGVVEQVDSPEGVYERPRSGFVAGFIGVSNLMPGTVASGGALELDAGVTVPATTNGLPVGARRQAVVRPEKLELSRLEDAAPAGRPNVEGLIEASVYLGTATQMVVRLAGDTTLTVLVPNVDEAQRQRLPGAGARVRLSWAPEHMHVIAESSPEPEAAEETEVTSTPIEEVKS